MIKIKRHQVKRIPFSRYLCIYSNLSVERIYDQRISAIHQLNIYNSVDIHIYLANKRHAPLLHSKNETEQKTNEKKNENAIKIIWRFFPFFYVTHWWWWRRRRLQALSTLDCISVKLENQPFLLSPHINQHYFIYNFLCNRLPEYLSTHSHSASPNAIAKQMGIGFVEHNKSNSGASVQTSGPKFDYA